MPDAYASRVNNRDRRDRKQRKRDLQRARRRQQAGPVRWWQRPHLAGQVSCLVVAVLGVPSGAVILGNEALLDERSSTAVGEVVDVNRLGRGPDTITVRFTTSAGVVQTTEIEGTGHRTGEAVTVDYYSDEPRRARFHDDNGQRDAGLLYVGTGVLGAFGFLNATLKSSRAH